jgi:hypothetical protein
MNTHFNFRSARLPLLASLSIALLAGGCAERRVASGAPESARPSLGTKPAGPAPAVPERPPIAAPTTGRAPAPIPDRALKIQADCTSRDERGYAEAIKLSVANGLVSQFEARITVPKRGSCSFRLADFRQTRSAPHVELVARSGSRCATRMWYQQNRFTVAFSDCIEMCTPRGTADYIWPIELRLSDGACR